MRTILRVGKFRIIELYDEDSSIEDLVGDCYSHEANPDIDKDVLDMKFKEFKLNVDRYGVFGYELQEWNSEIDCGWETIDSCYGFVGPYNKKDNDHYIVGEYEKEISERLK